MRGCDNMCTFCVVPYTRGRERSRDPEGVVDEVRALVRDGYKQVTLLGQNVNSYRLGEVRFADLMRRVADVPGIERVRFTSPHPKDFPADLIRAIAEHPKLCKHIHLPLQAGNDRVLDLMRRTYTNAEFRALVDEMRATIPGLGSDHRRHRRLPDRDRRRVRRNAALDGGRALRRRLHLQVFRAQGNIRAAKAPRRRPRRGKDAPHRRAG